MSFNRRFFLRSAALITCSLSELTAMAAKRNVNNVSTVKNDDEHYWESIRQLFPLVSNRSYLNNGTLGPSPYPVIEATHKGMMRADELGDYHHADRLLKRLAEFIGAESDELAYTNNVTHGINIACRGLQLQKGDEVIMTTHEHVGNAMPWLNRMKQDGIVIKVFSPQITAGATLKEIEALVTSKTKVIAIPHIPCTQGQIMPVKEVCELAHKHGVVSCIDGAHGPGMIPIDVKELGCDIYVSCGHKWMLGPKGTGFLYVKRDMRESVRPIFAAEYTADWELSEQKIFISEYRDTASIYFGGTLNSGLIDGLEESIDFLETIGAANVYSRIKYLGHYTQQQLLGLGDKIKLLTPTEERSYSGINSFIVKGVDNQKLYNDALKNGLRLRYVPESGLNCIRVSTHIYNSTQDIDKLTAFIKTYT